MADNARTLRLCIHTATESECLCKAWHRSGGNPFPISINDPILASDQSGIIGSVIGIEAEKIDRTDWLYRVRYRPRPNVSHPFMGYVLWRPAEDIVAPLVNMKQESVPDAIANRAAPISSVANGSHAKQRGGKKKRSTGQQGSGELAGSSGPTAKTVFSPGNVA